MDEKMENFINHKNPKKDARRNWRTEEYKIRMKTHWRGLVVTWTQ